MVITYYGVSCFKAQSGETVLAFDPPSKESEFKSPRFQADAVFVSHNHKDHNGQDSLAGEPIVMDGPGEYEIKGVYIAGIRSLPDNTIFSLSFEDISVCHLGDFGESELRPETKEAIGKVDILFVNINGGEMTPQKAARIVSQIEPKIVIPMHYHKDKNALKNFLDEFGNGGARPVEKLTIKKKDLSEKKTEVVVLSEI